MPDIFMNILTTNGYVQRFVNGWLAPAADIRSVRIRLGVPTYAADTLTFSGTVTAKRTEQGMQLVELDIRGRNRLGEHVAATVTVSLP
jgi:hypothetical protein